MKISDARLEGVFLLNVEWHRDDRGAFGRAWSKEALHEAGLRSDFVQSNISRTARAFTLRGLHYQVPPAAEAKLLRVTQGSIYDVCVDVRRNSATFGQWIGTELTASDGQSIYISEGLAHGFMSLADGTEVQYSSTAPHSAGHERGLRWDDPTVGIVWPHPPVALSNKDEAWPDFVAAEMGV